MKLVLISSLALAVSARHVSMAERRALFEFGVSNADCSTCFEKVDAARDCLRECNGRAYPGDSCCCCCDCEGSGGNNCHNNNQNKDMCDGGGKNTFTLDDDATTVEVTINCKWELDKESGNNKWYRIEEYCKCDGGGNQQEYKDNCDHNSDLKKNDDDLSLLDFCLGEDSHKTVESISDLQECCDFEDSKCDDYFTEVQDCLIGCLNPCLVMTAGEWLDCIRDNGESGGCSRQECLNGFLGDTPDGAEDIFDMKSIEKRVEKIDATELTSCSLLDDFVSSTCDVGTKCCDKCQSQLGASVDCLINDVVVPFTVAALNISTYECPIDTEKCEPAWPKTRGLVTEAEVEKFNKAASLPSTKKANRVVSGDKEERKLEGSATSTETTVSSQSQEDVSKCQRKMEQDIMMYNMSYATNTFMTCIMELGYSAMPDDATGSTTSTTTTSSAATLVSLFGLVSAMVFAALF